MKNIKYVQLEPTAFLADIDFQLMSAEQRGVYCSVIFYLYANGGKLKLSNGDTTLLSSSDSQLAAISNCFKVGREWSDVWQDIAHKFRIRGNVLTHKRVTAELERAESLHLSRSEAGKKGMASRYGGNEVSIPVISKRREEKISEEKGSKKKRKNKEKIRHLEHVFLLADEWVKLKGKYGFAVVEDYIERLNNYVGSSGKKYKSHYHTILTWIRKDEREGISTTQQATQRKTGTQSQGKRARISEQDFGELEDLSSDGKT